MRITATLRPLSSADGKLVADVEEERFNRVNTPLASCAAIRYCLKEAGSPWLISITWPCRGNPYARLGTKTLYALRMPSSLANVPK